MQLSETHKRYLVKSQYTPDRIIVGQIATTHAIAEKFVAKGLWEKSEIEEFQGKLHQRYRLTQTGRDLIEKFGLTDA